jgi:TPR repeat protein
VASIVSQARGRGVTRSKRRAMQWLRKAAENSNADACLHLAKRMYTDQPYAREVGHLVEAAGVAAPAGVMEGHEVPRDVLTGVVHWLQKGGHKSFDKLALFRREALAGAPFARLWAF